MKKTKLHKRFLAILIIILLISCSKKNYPSNNTEELRISKPENEYTPPPVISITDDKVRSNKDGELYYDNEYGYRYWRYCDGKYYLDAKYENGAKPSKKIMVKEKEKQVKKEQQEEYTSSN
jgi:hypothetical protein